ncbi:MAG: NAD(P)H-hydrate dehydratase [Clostridia bacterium]|nr:NAD(P)H-hydrate dehydratase [Clostridia bacterium]
MKLVTASEMKRLDELASSRFGISPLILMENAGRGIAEGIINEFFKGNPFNKRVLIFSGKGNNGGDGFVVARHLANKGADVRVFLLKAKGEITGDALVNLNILESMEITISVISEPKDLKRIDISLLYADLVVDAIFGTGFKGKAAGLAAQVIDRLNRSGKPIVSVDLPSGLEADTGKAKGPCIQAAKTYTLGLPKLGLYLFPGRKNAGEISLVDISFPEALLKKMDLHHNLITRGMCEGFFEKRDPESHKGTFGRVIVIGGSEGMSGAAAMAAEAALRSGAGLVTAAVPRSINPILENKLTEVMTYPLPETEERVLGVEAVDVLLDICSEADVVAVGPGLSSSRSIFTMLKEFLPRVEAPLVLDADALNALSQDVSLFSKINVPVIITPHPGEMARLTGSSVSEIQEDRLNAALKAAREWNVVAVLKGAGTIVATPKGEVYINETGNPGMATGGTGDVLTGIIAGFLAQGMTPEAAAAAGVFVHGFAGDMLLGKKGFRGMTAGDIIEMLPAAILQLENGFNN